MNRQELKNILQSTYDRDLWISTLQFLTGKRDFLTVQLSPLEIEIYTVESQRLIKTFFQIGYVKTSDGVMLPIFEISLADGVQIEHNRVGVNEFIKKYIIKDAIRGALVTFSYDNDLEKTEWRFSFISKNSASDFFAEAEAQETNPKKFTYIFGTDEEHRTAIERLYNLEQSRFRLEDFFEAFNVAPVSKKFFEEYKMLYREFSDFIISEPGYYKFFQNPKDETVKPEKEIRNFVGRFLGRIVFLYFLQKKNWLGASDENYKDGSTTFLSDLFSSDVENQNEFYQKYLCPIFFNALNNSDRENNKFKLENGETVCIPFLNGGLFEEEQEPKNHRTIQFPAHRFKMLFDFFNGFNFTVYENSPEEHIVAVDPEMLGHIFENLIDYNKDTGTFYTPKEIVQYMTQESLIEYLNTHLQKEREEIENLIKNQTSADFEDTDLVKINELLDAVKICDPAIGSGAFPMGMLQEIFNLKALIAYQLKTDFYPAETKQNIIQNSIYGVDLDEGAVEIARLRFWLSLVVDEGMPKALPNLDYKIMQGNSLLESYKGIDLSGVSSGNDLKIIEEMQVDLFGNLVDDQMKMTVGKSGLAEEIQKLIKKYFTAKSVDKKKIKVKIQSKIAEHISFNLELRENQLYRQINELEQNLKNLKPNQKKALEKYKADAEILEQTKLDLIKEQAKDEKSYFLWNLFFGDVLSKGGFDIVIGNPPYIKEYTNKSAFYGLRDSPFYKGKMDIWYAFASLGFNILKENGTECFIAQNNWITSAGASVLRDDVLKRTEIKQFIDFGDYKVFQSAGIQTMIYLLQKRNNPSANYQVQYSLLLSHPQNKDELTSFLKFKTENNFSEKYNFNLIAENFSGKTISFNDSQIDTILKKIENKGTFKLHDDEVAQGIVPNPDITNSRNITLIDKSKIEKYNIKIGDGVFAVDKDFFISLSDVEKKYIKPLYEPYQLKKYSTGVYDKEILYITKQNYNNDAPTLISHLEKYREIMDNRRENKNSRLDFYDLHWSRNKSFFEPGEKILSIRKCSVPTFVYTTDEAYSMMSINTIRSKRIDMKFLTLLLNSKLVEFWLKNMGKMQGDNFQIDKEPLLSIPLLQHRNTESFHTLFNEIHTLTQQEESIVSIQKQINIIIYKLYELSYEDVQVIDDSVSLIDFQSYQSHL